MINLIGILTAILMTICPGPPGGVFLARYEWHDGWVFAEGLGTIDLTGDAQSVTWTSAEMIVAVVSKSGQDCTEWPGGYSGTITADNHDLSHLDFYAYQIATPTPDPTGVTVSTFTAQSISGEVCTGYTVFMLCLVLLALFFHWAVTGKEN